DLEIDTKYYVAEDEVNRRKLNPSFPTVVYRLIARNTDPQTFIATMLPKAGVGHSAGVFQSVVDQELLLPLLGVLNSRLFDFIVKSKSSGANVSFFITKQLPLPPLEDFKERINPKTENSFKDDITALVQQLIPTTTTMAKVLDLEEQDDWNAERRETLKAQLDELVFDYYGITEEMRQYVLYSNDEE
ncbi:MAG: hypothetical protein VXU46_01025, partial [Planctomycetota bacterium]|nr:hypothetical protein [Planctomycetota bacterium]